MTGADLTAIRSAVRRGCQNRAQRDLLLAALDHPALTGARHTRSGVMVFTAQGMVAAHFTGSEGKRGTQNLRAQLRRIGLTV